MNKLRAFIVDDEWNSIQALKFELEELADEVVIIDSFQKPDEAIKALTEPSIDLLFLDIEMPGMNGFELLRSLKNINFEVIFTTAYDSYAIEAFKSSAIDYLLKPIGQDELRNAIIKAKNRLSSQSIENHLADLLETYAFNNPGKKKLLFSTMDGLEFVDMTEIVRCESDKNYTTIYLQHEQKLTISKTLKDIESKLDSTSFVRVHHSHIVNIEFIRRYVRGAGGHIELKDKTIVPVSRKRKEDFLARFG